jgi:hypothetical protein
MKSNVNIPQEGQNYTAPAVAEMEFLQEGILCTSNNLSIGDWEREDETLEF